MCIYNIYLPIYLAWTARDKEMECFISVLIVNLWWWKKDMYIYIERKREIQARPVSQLQLTSSWHDSPLFHQRFILACTLVTVVSLISKQRNSQIVMKVNPLTPTDVLTERYEHTLVYTQQISSGITLPQLVILDSISAFSTQRAKISNTIVLVSLILHWPW